MEPRGIEMVIDMLRTLGISEADVRDWMGREVDLFTIGEAVPEDEDDDLPPQEADIGRAA